MSQLPLLALRQNAIGFSPGNIPNPILQRHREEVYNALRNARGDNRRWEEARNDAVRALTADMYRLRARLETMEGNVEDAERAAAQAEARHQLSEQDRAETIDDLNDARDDAGRIQALLDEELANGVELQRELQAAQALANRRGKERAGPSAAAAAPTADTTGPTAVTDDEKEALRREIRQLKAQVAQFTDTGDLSAEDLTSRIDEYQTDTAKTLLQVLPRKPPEDAPPEEKAAYEVATKNATDAKEDQEDSVANLTNDQLAQLRTALYEFLGTGIVPIPSFLAQTEEQAAAYRTGKGENLVNQLVETVQTYLDKESTPAVRLADIQKRRDAQLERVAIARQKKEREAAERLRKEAADLENQEVYERWTDLWNKYWPNPDSRLRTLDPNGVKRFANTVTLQMLVNPNAKDISRPGFLQFGMSGLRRPEVRGLIYLLKDAETQWTVAARKRLEEKIEELETAARAASQRDEDLRDNVLLNNELPTWLSRLQGVDPGPPVVAQPVPQAQAGPSEPTPSTPPRRPQATQPDTPNTADRRVNNGPQPAPNLQDLLARRQSLRNTQPQANPDMPAVLEPPVLAPPAGVPRPPTPPTPPTPPVAPDPNLVPVIRQAQAADRGRNALFDAITSRRQNAPAPGSTIADNTWVMGVQRAVGHRV